MTVRAAMLLVVRVFVWVLGVVSGSVSGYVLVRIGRMGVQFIASFRRGLVRAVRAFGSGSECSELPEILGRISIQFMGAHRGTPSLLQASPAGRGANGDDVIDDVIG